MCIILNVNNSFASVQNLIQTEMEASLHGQGKEYKGRFCLEILKWKWVRHPCWWRSVLFLCIFYLEDRGHVDNGEWEWINGHADQKKHREKVEEQEGARPGEGEGGVRAGETNRREKREMRRFRKGTDSCLPCWTDMTIVPEEELDRHNHKIWRRVGQLPLPPPHNSIPPTLYTYTNTHMGYKIR